MSETIINEIPSLNDLTTETNSTVNETGVHNEDDETWLYGNNNPNNEENIDNTTAPSIDEITTLEIDAREKATIVSTSMPIATSLIGSQLDDDSDDDDDGIQITIGNYEPEASNFQTMRQKNRGMLTAGSVVPPKPSITRGVDFDAQGVINGQTTYEYDISNAYKDEEKPWKKPGADISDYFNYGFTEETWALYCDRQRRLRSDNSLPRLNPAHMPPMLSGHPPMIHPMNPHSVMMMNKPINLQMMTRPMNIRRPDGKIDVIGATDQTSRRQMFELQNNFDHQPFMNGPMFPGGQPPNGQTVGDLVSSPPVTNGLPPSHGIPAGGTHHISTLGAHQIRMMPLPPGMQFRSPFGHPHASGGPQFFPRGPAAGMHGDRHPPPYFVHQHPQQPWDKSGGGPPGHSFPPGPFPPQVAAPTNSGNGRAPYSRSPTPEDHSSRSSTPEGNRPSGGDNDKSSKDDRYQDRYRDDRDHHSSSRRRPSSKDRSSSSSYHTHHRGGEHEYERPRNDRKSPRERDDKYERHSRKRHHDTNRHHRDDEESSRNHRLSQRTPTKNGSSPLKTNPSIPTLIESSQILNDQPEVTTLDQPSTSSPAVNRLRHDDSERSSSRHSHHKKSSKRSRHDSDNERSSSHHHRQSKEKPSISSKKSTNQTESVPDVKE